jgi:single-stranded-DNA-specific exonuclease
LSHSRWKLLPPVPERHLANSSGLPPLLVQLLYNRGITRPEDFRSFLEGDRSLTHDPFLLPDMHRAIARVYRALLAGEKIAIYGDFDADGITATAVLVQGLAALGVKAIPYIPHRQTEGHGLATAALKNLRQQGVSLVITVDCGVTDLSQVKQAVKMGLDIVITDHHSPLSELPQAVAAVDPKLPGSSYPFSPLAGVGVAFKMLQALFQNLGREEPLGNTDLVAIGTIADMSPLVGENRYLVREGLKILNTSPRLGLKELMGQTGLATGTINENTIGWIIAPCLNAAGRMADGLTGYNLLVTEAPPQARELAVWLVQKNDERQRLTTSTLAVAREQVIAQGLPPLLVASDKDYFIGVAGLVASRLAEEFYRPAIVVSLGEKISHASCRSIPEFNIIAALSQSGPLLSRYGGHAQAAGFTLPTKNLPILKEVLSQLAAEQLAGVEPRPRLDIDAEVTLPELGGTTYPTTLRLAPFGMGNQVPTFLSRGVEVLQKGTMGDGGDHLKLKLRQGGTVWDGVGFRLGNHQTELADLIDIVYNLEADRWGGKEQLRLNILDLARST